MCPQFADESPESPSWQAARRRDASALLPILHLRPTLFVYASYDERANRGLLMGNVEYGGRGEGCNCISCPFAVVSHMLRCYSVAALRFGNTNRRDSASLQGWCFRLETCLREGCGMQMYSPPLCISVPPISRESSANRPDCKTVSIIAQKLIRDPAHVVGRRRETAGFSIG